MKKNKISLFVTALVIAACSTNKKATTTNTSTTQASQPNYVLLGNEKPAEKPNTPPGNNELDAIQAEYKDATIEKLTEGYTIYTAGACINCHLPVNISEINTDAWKNILNDMAQRATISDLQKDAVNKYVLSVKAAQKK